MSRAREEKERVREITERGYSTSQTRPKTEGVNKHYNSVMSSASQNNAKGKIPRPKTSKALRMNADLRVPLLLVDIGIGDRKERIAVYEGDRADKLAREFCIRHGLDVGNIAIRLQEEIERQIELINS